MAVCPSGRQCVWWAERYLKDCLCGLGDYVSLGFGLVSVFSWAVAEIPQIITSFKSGTTEGISLAFLMTWIVGDLFNLIGCLLEPATLPTQLYTAVIYTITTVILGSQAAYYDYISKWWKGRKANTLPMQHEECASNDQSRKHKKTKTKPENESESIADSAELARDTDLERFSTENPTSSSPIPSKKNLYYMSARSLASSHTPPLGSYLSSPSRELGRSAPNFTSNLTPVKDEESLTDLVSTSSSSKSTLRSVGFHIKDKELLTDLVSKSPNSKATLRSVAATLFFVGVLNFFRVLNVHNNPMTTFDSTKVERTSVILIGRRILQFQGVSAITASDLMKQEQSTSLVGTCLGWLMAAIYMGGRLPQICLNVKRGTVEGLNPLMFIFAIIGNAAYVLSIVVRTLEWRKLKPNMPWLVDAAACVLLDCLIVTQFFYYKIRKPKIIKPEDHEEDKNGDYFAIKLHGPEN